MYQLLLSNLKEYSIRVDEKVRGIFTADVKFAIKKVQEDIDNGKIKTTTESS